MTKETFQKLLDLYKTLIEINGEELMYPDFNDEIEILREVITDAKLTTDD